MVATVLPVAVGVPVIIPPVASMLSPAGSPAALKPVALKASTSKEKGWSSPPDTEEKRRVLTTVLRAFERRVFG